MNTKVLLSAVMLALVATTAFAEVEITLPSPEPGQRLVRTVTPAGGSRIAFRVTVPIRDVQLMWMPGWQVPRQDRKWWIAATSAPQCDMPYVAYFNSANENAYSIGVATLEHDTRIESKINQEKGVWEVLVTVEAGPGRKLTPFAVTLDRRSLDWTRVLADWRNSLVLPKGTYPTDAWKPVYCSWYAVHAAVTQDWTEQTATLAADLGFKTFILDDGWSYDEMKRVNPETIKTWYRDTGRWDAFSKKKFPDFKAHRAKMRALGLNYLVWVSPYFIGTRSEAFRKYGYDKGPQKPFEGNVLADPADRAFMDSVDDQLVRLLREADLDGVKIDFLDYIKPSVDIGDPTAPKSRGGVSLDYIERLMAKLRAVKPNGLFEFRQSYATPITAHLATQFRAGDVPFEWLANLLSLAQIRITMGDGVPIHADPIFWAKDETPDNVNRHFLAAFAGVPMVSMDLAKLTASERETIRKWLRFYTTEIEPFQRRGAWHVHYKNANVAAVTATLDGRSFLLVNDPDVFPQLLRSHVGHKLTVANLTYVPLSVGPSATVPPAQARVF